MNEDAFVIHLAVSRHESRPFLKIPVTHAAIFAFKPLKWIRYAAAAVLGAEGELSTLDKQALDFENSQPTSCHLLYTPTKPIRFIDIDGLNHVKSSQFTTESHTSFQNEIMARDEHKCVISDQHSAFCDAVHLIPHSEGSVYIKALCCWRTRKNEPEIEIFTDIRNGMCANKLIHMYFAVDVLPAPIVAQEDIPFFFTPHYFFPDDEVEYRNIFPRDCRYPPVDWEETWPRDWPPHFLWDFIYGVIISNKYRVEEAIDALNQESNHQYYPEGIKTATQKVEAEIAQRKREHDQKVKNQNQEDRDARALSNSQQQLMDSFDRVFCSWMHHRFGPLGQKTRVQDEAKLFELEQEQHQLKANEIAKWQEDVAKTCPKLDLEPDHRSNPFNRPNNAMS